MSVSDSVSKCHFCESEIKGKPYRSQSGSPFCATCVPIALDIFLMMRMAASEKIENAIQGAVALVKRGALNSVAQFFFGPSKK